MYYRNTFSIVIVDDLIKNKVNNIQCYGIHFYELNNSKEVVFGISFYILSRADIWFTKHKASRAYVLY